jgi:hypothetical protein
MPVILATQEAMIRKIEVQGTRPYLENNYYKKGLMKGLKLQALSSNPSTAKKKVNWSEAPRQWLLRS